MSSSQALAPSDCSAAVASAAQAGRKRSRAASLDPTPDEADTFIRGPKQARTRAATDAERLPGPSVVRWPELYVDSVAASLACDRVLADAGRIQRDNASALIRGQGNRIGVVLGLHGLSAGPWQFAELAQAYAARGLDLYVPRMVAHGLRYDGRPDPATMPDLDAEEVYVRYARVAFNNARSYAADEGLPLLFAAHSFGAALAGVLVQDHPEDIAGQVYIHPLHAPTSWVARLKFWVARMIRHTSWGRTWLQRSRHIFVIDPKGIWPGYPTLPLSKIFPVLNLARKVWRSFKPTAVPTMLFVSDCDRTCDPVPILKTAHTHFKDVTVHRFGRKEQVDHAAVSAIENPRQDIRETIYRESANFLVARAQAWKAAKTAAVGKR